MSGITIEVVECAVVVFLYWLAHWTYYAAELEEDDRCEDNEDDEHDDENDKEEVV